MVITIFGYNYNNLLYTDTLDRKYLLKYNHISVAINIYNMM